MAKLREGDVIPLCDGGEVVVVKAGPDKLELGAGGQGYVYKVRDSAGNHYALKWYKRLFLDDLDEIGRKQEDPQRQTSRRKFYENLRELSKVKPPSSCSVWPKAVTGVSWDKVFGYVMNLIPPNYTPLVRILNGRVFMSKDVLITACLNLCDAFDSYHTRGYSYQDLNYGGVYIDVSDGSVLICDNDNVAPDNTSLTNVGGFPGYMAPEILEPITVPSGQNPTVKLPNPRNDFPSRVSDYHSLAVIFFQLMMLGHPLDGANEAKISVRSREALQVLYGTHAEFVFSPSGNNKPIPGVHDIQAKYWGTYPKFLRDAFLQAFSFEALHGSRAERSKVRLSERQWKQIFIRLRNQLIECPSCHRLIFADPGLSTVSCPVEKPRRCGEKFRYPVSLRAPQMDPIPIVGGRTIMQADVERFGDRDVPVMKFGTSPQKPGAIGLINQGQTTWNLAYANGSTATLNPGEFVVVTDGVSWINGLNIQVGDLELTVS